MSKIIFKKKKNNNKVKYKVNPYKIIYLKIIIKLMSQNKIQFKNRLNLIHNPILKIIL